MGGPDGGDGGRGGSIIVRGDSNLATLLDYTYRDKWIGERGEHGMGSNKSGRSGEDIVMPVPPGTILRDTATGEIIAEILDDGQEIVIAPGGRGGKGNSFFATPTHQSPREQRAAHAFKCVSLLPTSSQHHEPGRNVFRR